ncbi:MAG: hypothetical protein V4515_15045 [Chloroflexota bacterium]
MMLVSLLIAVVVIASYLSFLIAGDNVLPAPYNGLLFAVVSTAVIVAVTKWIAKDIGRAIDRLEAKVDRNEANTERRTARIHSALVQQGVTIAENTGEIPRINVVQPRRGLDPDVMDIGRRIARRMQND